jgi:hypothetical protein
VNVVHAGVVVNNVNNITISPLLIVKEFTFTSLMTGRRAGVVFNMIM